MQVDIRSLFTLPIVMTILVVSIFLLLVPVIKVLRRTGHHPLWGLFAIFPGLNLFARNGGWEMCGMFGHRVKRNLTNEGEAMALPPSGTFYYVVKVPKEKGPDSFPWQLELGEEIEPSGDAIFDDRLVGYSPLMWVSDGGITADSFGLRGEVRVSRFTLRAMNQKNAAAREVSFQIDWELTTLFQVDDELRLSHSDMWGTGLTLLRTGKLVFAVGAIDGSKLGGDIRMRHPEDAPERIQRFESVPF